MRQFEGYRPACEIARTARAAEKKSLKRNAPPSRNFGRSCKRIHAWVMTPRIPSEPIIMRSGLGPAPKIQIQVCSPGRLGARRSALLAIGFYLGSDTLRRYTLGDLATSFSENQHYPRGRRLVLYDAEGDFDRNFDWWKESGKHRLVEPQLPFENGRSDL